MIERINELAKIAKTRQLTKEEHIQIELQQIQLVKKLMLK